MRRGGPGYRRLFARVIGYVPDGLLRAGSYGMVDQVVISGINFVTMVAAVRALGPAAYGLFALLYTVLLFLQGVQETLVTMPHNVMGVSRAGSGYRRYTTSVAAIQVTIAAAIGLATVLAAAIIWRFDAPVASMTLAMACAAVGWNLQEFTRRVLYTESRLVDALVNDVVTYGTRVPAVGVLFLTGTLTGELFFLVMGLTWLTGAALGVWQIRDSLRRAFDWSVVREHWEFGRWLFASSAVSHTPRYVTAAVLSSVLSVSAFGAYRAFEQLVNAANVPLQALNNVIRTRLARDAESGPRAVTQTMTPLLVIGALSLAGFAAVVILLRDPLIGAIYGAEYTDYTVSLILVALIPLMRLDRSLVTIALQAVRQTRQVFISTVIGTTFGCTVGTAAVFAFGLPAAGAIMVLSLTGAVLWRAWAWRRILRESDQTVGVSARTFPSSTAE